MTPFSSSDPHARLNPGVKGLKVFTAIKRARLIPESIFRNTHTRYVHVHAWRANNHYFWSPVLILLFTIERLVAAKNGARDECVRGTAAASFCVQPRQCDTSMNLVQGVTFLSDLRRHVVFCLLNNQQILQNQITEIVAPALRRVPTKPHLFPYESASPVLPCATNLAGHE